MRDVTTEIVAGGDIDKDLILDEGRYPVIANALTNDGIVGYYNTDYRIEAPAVTVTGRGDVGHAKARIVDFTPVVRLLSIKSYHDVFFLENAINTLKIVIESTGVPQLTVPQLAKYEISFPKSLDEEEKIGNFFCTIDNLITLHQRKLDKMKELKKAFLNLIFSQKLRFYGFTESWELRKLPEFVNFYSGLTYTPDNVQESGTLVLRSSNVKNGEIIDADNVYVNIDIVNSENVQDGDIIVVIRNGSRALIGKHAQIKGFRSNTVIGAFMTGIRSEHPAFVNALLDTPAFEIEIAKNLGATINQITGYMFSKMEFAIPSSKEQIEIGKFFLNLDNLITLHQKKIDSSKEMKKILLKNMLI